MQARRPSLSSRSWDAAASEDCKAEAAGSHVSPPTHNTSFGNAETRFFGRLSLQAGETSTAPRCFPGSSRPPAAEMLPSPARSPLDSSVSREKTQLQHPPPLGTLHCLNRGSPFSNEESIRAPNAGEGRDLRKQVSHPVELL
ncbi:Hypothetical predicted protein [Podarcis lilfordi]|uniref:Uncharacterized protein n=1 Tax=Podarcis lilfordi TaxID=74358 RepID=A0AA35K9N8_9SAUR|nr:Hypothetical predicted protein [Podarcis lilfordi]